MQRNENCFGIKTEQDWKENTNRHTDEAKTETERKRVDIVQEGQVEGQKLKRERARESRDARDGMTKQSKNAVYLFYQMINSLPLFQACVPQPA